MWEKFVADKKVDTDAGASVFYTTPPYYDYNWTRARRHAGRAAQEAAARPSSRWTRPRPRAQEILALQRATRFVPTAAENYAGIRAAAENAGLLK